MFLAKRIGLVLFILVCGACALKFGFYDPFRSEGPLKDLISFSNLMANVYLFVVYSLAPGFVAVLIHDKVVYGSITTNCAYPC